MAYRKVGGVSMSAIFETRPSFKVLKVFYNQNSFFNFQYRNFSRQWRVSSNHHKYYDMYTCTYVILSQIYISNYDRRFTR